MVKMCTTCGLDKNVPDDFHRRGDGFASECKGCRSERDKGIYRGNGEAIRRRKLWVNPSMVSGNKNPTCKECKRGIDEVPFGTKKFNGTRYYRHLCKECSNKGRSQRCSPEALAVRVKIYQKKVSQQRKDLVHVEKWIYTDCRASDKKRGVIHLFDLTKEIIRDLIANGCTYCGDTQLRMTLDRVDNSKGHSTDNVVPACIRCNYVRGAMPHEAWVIVAKGMKEAQMAGLFGDWTGRIK